MTRWSWIFLIVPLAGPAFAEGEVVPGDAVTGEALYRAHCAVCHGIEATGHGPMVTALTVQPSDLTTLVARHGGEFPLERVTSRIDGRDPLVAHGSAMPVYGNFFEGHDVALKTETGQPLMTSQPIADLVAWLRTIQK
ncbi:c-type cytochrome [Tabrizicola sp. BL-A-41-H6]|uniref:c-type cytochrome n=1 Tax=Tabrizicola sp. BL-A-41-H6 TaxID=3421107 RepID=UPI003D67C9C5